MDGDWHGAWGHYLCLSDTIFDEPTCGKRDILFTVSVQCMCMSCACVHSSIRICLAITCTFMHGFQNNLVQLSS